MKPASTERTALATRVQLDEHDVEHDESQHQQPENNTGASPADATPQQNGRDAEQSRPPPVRAIPPTKPTTASTAQAATAANRPCDPRFLEATGAASLRVIPEHWPRREVSRPALWTGDCRRFRLRGE
jgi:hypothetical protein